MCIHDKLDQTFPSGNLLMVNIPYQIESRIELHSLVHDLADNTDDDSVDTMNLWVKKTVTLTTLKENILQNHRIAPPP